MFRPFLVFAIVASHGATLTSASQCWEQCLRLAYPLTRAEFPELLNCLGLEGSAAEVGVQAGVHASSFLQVWRGRRLILVDSWSYVDENTSDGIFYVDIANVHGAGSGRQHRTSCEKRLAEELRVGRAERSRYFALWRQQQGEAASSEAVSSGFGISCRDLCGQDCKVRVQTFTPTRTVGSTLRPFACATAGPAVEAPVTCAAEMLVDVQAYLDVCHERCSVTCQQRERLFSLHSGKLLSV